MGRRCRMGEPPELKSGSVEFSLARMETNLPVNFIEMGVRVRDMVGQDLTRISAFGAGFGYGCECECVQS